MDFGGRGTGLAVLARQKLPQDSAGSGKAVSRAHVSDDCTILPLTGAQGCGWAEEAGASAFHTIAVKVAQQQAQVQVHGATSGCMQAIAVSPTVDGVPMQQLRPTTHEGPCQLLPPASQRPPCGTVQLVGAWTAGHMTKAVASKLAAAEAILGPHLEMKSGPACKTGERDGAASRSLSAQSSSLASAPASSLDSHSHTTAKWIFLNSHSSPAQNPFMAPQCLQNKTQPQHSADPLSCPCSHLKGAQSTGERAP